jgi:hypothetical protein
MQHTINGEITQRPTGRDLGWGLLALVALVLASGMMFALCSALGLESSPPFSRNLQPLTGDRLR